MIDDLMYHIWVAYPYFFYNNQFIKNIIKCINLLQNMFYSQTSPVKIIFNRHLKAQLFKEGSYLNCFLVNGLKIGEG